MTNEQLAAYISGLIALAIEMKTAIWVNAQAALPDNQDAKHSIHKPAEQFVRALETQYKALTGQWP